MEASSASSVLIPMKNGKKGKGKGKGDGDKGSRRVWTIEEERVLINALYEYKAAGNKVDNNFRAGYLRDLEDFIRKEFSDTNILGDPHVKSKITVWRRVYSHLYSLFGVTGGCATYDPETQKIKCSDELWWIEYKRVHAYVKGYRVKKFSFYEDWEKLFGKDRVNGGGAEDISAAVHDVMNNTGLTGKGNSGVIDGARPSRGRRIKTETPSPSSVRGEDMPSDINVGSSGTDYNLPTRTNDKLSAKAIMKKIKKARGKKKRLALEKAEKEANEVPPYIEEFMHKTEQSIERVVTLFSQSHAIPKDPTTILSKSIFDELEKYDEFDEEQKMVLAHKLAHNKEDADLFFNMPESSKPKYLKFLLKHKPAK